MSRQQYRAARGAAQVDPEPAVPPRARVVLKRQPGERSRPTRAVHPDHLGTEIAEQHGGEGNRTEAAQAHHAHVAERLSA